MPGMAVMEMLKKYAPRDITTRDAFINALTVDIWHLDDSNKYNASSSCNGKGWGI